MSTRKNVTEFLSLQTHHWDLPHLRQAMQNAMELHLRPSMAGLRFQTATPFRNPFASRILTKPSALWAESR